VSFTVLDAAAPAPDVAVRGSEGFFGCITSGVRTLMGVLTLDGDA
jgi:hypothetical protein